MKKVNKYYDRYAWRQNEFDALVSFAFNVGSIDQLSANGTRSKKAIGEKIILYNKAGEKSLQGLQSVGKKSRSCFWLPRRAAIPRRIRYQRLPTKNVLY